jgi:hypothetical protein
MPRHPSSQPPMSWDALSRWGTSSSRTVDRRQRDRRRGGHSERATGICDAALTRLWEAHKHLFFGSRYFFLDLFFFGSFLQVCLPTRSKRPVRAEHDAQDLPQHVQVCMHACSMHVVTAVCMHALNCRFIKLGPDWETCAPLLGLSSTDKMRLMMLRLGRSINYLNPMRRYRIKIIKV